MKKFLELFFGRLLFICLGFLIQFIILVAIVWRFREYFVYFFTFSSVIAVLTVLLVIDNEQLNPSYRIAWIVAILIVPTFGWLFYFLFGGNKLSRSARKNLEMLTERNEKYLIQDEHTYRDVKRENRQTANLINYFYKYAGYPIYYNESCEYFSVGEEMHERLLEELKKAEKFIFMEYFIIEEGVMWDSILDILKQKAASGVEVRLMYDDMGCMMLLPKDYPQKLETFGIKCCVFNPINPVFTIRYNNRNHRKITVIDGKTAFTGGVNLADEYINKKVKYGHWKDTAVMIRGEAVWNFTVMLLSAWNYLKKSSEDFLQFKAECSYAPADGFVLPYTDSPLDNEIVGETVYMDIIENAKDYVYITTPYLILDNEMTVALCNAAKKGVDVRIITPHIPDKRVVFDVTRANYIPLIRSGVKIYEYSPGFIHAKSCVADDTTAVVGTINFDYRSLYLHFECALFMYKTKCIGDIKKDFIKTQEKSEIIGIETVNKLKRRKRIYRSVLKLFAPMM